MNTTIPTPEGPFDSIVFLGDRMDWPAWYDDVSAIARALGIWRYIDPDSQSLLSEPIKPSVPTRPNLKHSAVHREPYETDKTFHLRIDQERHAHALSVRDHNILCEQYRVDTAHYLSQLAEYTSAKDDLQKLNRIIYRSVPERYRAYLKLDKAKTPRAMILSLRSKIKPPTDKDRASAALRTFNSTLNVQPDDDKHAFIEAIALATVELHRVKGDRFDEGTAVKDLLRALQVLDEEFAETWISQGGKKAVLDIVEEFKAKLRKDESSAYTRKQRDSNVPDVRVPREPQIIGACWAPIFNGHQNGHATPAENKIDVPSGKKDNQGSVRDGFSETEWPDNGHEANEDWPVAEKLSQLQMDERFTDATLPTVPLNPFRKEFKPRNFDTSSINKDDEVSRSGKSRRASTNGAPPPTGPAADKSSTASKVRKTTDQVDLVMRDCPGCELRHLVRDDAWWENCYVYWELNGIGNVPDNFVSQERRLDLAFSRLQDCPNELRRAEEWASSRHTLAHRKSSLGAASQPSSVAATAKSRKSRSRNKNKAGGDLVKEAQPQTKPQHQDQVQAQTKTQPGEFALW